MHWRTYERLCDEHGGLEDVVIRDCIARFGLTYPDIRWP
jgi:hypothetical protein